MPSTQTAQPRADQSRVAQTRGPRYLIPQRFGHHRRLPQRRLLIGRWDRSSTKVSAMARWSHEAKP